MSTKNSLEINRSLGSFRKSINKTSQPRYTVDSGYVSAVQSDGSGKIVSATVAVPGRGSVRAKVNFGQDVYTGMGVEITNLGSPSNASWTISGSSYVPAGTSGGVIINQNGNVTAMFDNIWVIDDGFIRAGGTEDPDGNPTGSRVELTQVGLFGYGPYSDIETVFALYTREVGDDHLIGDLNLGYLTGGNIRISPESRSLGIYNGDEVVVLFDQLTGNRITKNLWVGDEAGPQVGIGRFYVGEEQQAVIVARSAGTGTASEVGNEPLFMVAAYPGRVTVHTGDPDHSTNYSFYDSAYDNGPDLPPGRYLIDGVLRAREIQVFGAGLIAENGYISTHDTNTYAGIKLASRYLEGTGTGGDRTFLMVGAAVTLPKHPQLPAYGNKSWVGGEGYWGDLLSRHFRVERGANARIGLFNADTPLVWADFDGNAYIKGQLTASEGEVIVGRTGNGIEVFLPVGAIDDVKRLFTFVDQNYISYGGVWSGSDSVDSEAYETVVSRVNMHFGTYANATSITGARSHVRILSNSHANRQAVLKLQAAGNNGAADPAMIELLSYGGDDGAYGMIRMTGIPRLVPYTTAPTATTGQSLSDGLFAFPDGSGWDPLTYISNDYLVALLNAEWVPIAQAWGTEWRRGNGSTNYTSIDGNGSMTFVGTARLWPRYQSETQNSSASYNITKLLTYANSNTTGTQTATLPDATDATIKGMPFMIIKIDSSVNAVNVTPYGAQTINGSASAYSLTTQWQTVTLVSNGSNWLRIWY